MTCWYWHRLLSEYLDAELAPPRRRGVERHLERCARTRDLLAELTELKTAAARLDQLELPEGGWARLRARLGAAPAPVSNPWFAPARLRLAGLGLACAALLWIALHSAYRTPLQKHLIAELEAAERAAAPSASAPAAALRGTPAMALLQGRLEVERAVRNARRALLANPNHPAAKRSYVRALHQLALLSDLRLT
ncbi:MAG TPA: zf-HC2 domain-containing protein [Acidobacteriota bacterium]